MKKYLLFFLLLLMISACTAPQTAVYPTPEPIHLQHLPLVLSTYATTVGVESEASWSYTKVWYNPRTNLKTSCRWAYIEETKGVYDWTSCDSKLPPNQSAFWITFKTSPDWSRTNGTLMCEIPRKDHWKDAANAVQNVINRYNPKYVELWNEPDPYPEQMPAKNTHLYGCVGDADLYVEFYNYIQQHVTGSVLVAGAFANTSGEFAKTVVTELSDTADAFSFHCYPYYYGEFSTDVCARRYQNVSRLTTKPISISETAVYYYSGSIAGYEQAQLTHYIWLQDSGHIFFWYSVVFNGWPYCTPEPCNTDMITRKNSEFVPRPVWYVYIDH